MCLAVVDYRFDPLKFGTENVGVFVDHNGGHRLSLGRGTHPRLLGIQAVAPVLDNFRGDLAKVPGITGKFSAAAEG